MFPPYGGFISDIQKRTHQHRESDRAATERQDPLIEWTRTSKQLATDHHATFPAIELIDGNQVSDREREIEGAKKRSPRKYAKREVHTDTRAEHEYLLHQRPTLQCG